MDALIEARLVKCLHDLVKRHGLNGNYNDRAVKKFEEERKFLLGQFKELEDEQAWWSDHEWDWFLNRCLQFLEDYR